MPLMFCPCCSYLLLLTTCLYFNHKIYIIIEKVALYSNTNTAKHMTLYIQCFAYVIATCFYFNHLNQIKVVLYCHTIKLYDDTKNICKLSSKQWVRIAYNNYIANLMKITIYGSRKKSHDYINNISNLLKKLVRMVYNITYTNNILPIDANDNI
jgi:hypothetical protein